jgi:hypothetical protein
MAAFTVEVVQTEAAPSCDDGKMPSDESHHPVHMVVQGTQGYCQIQGVPLQTTLMLRVYHATMRAQAVEFTMSRLKVGFVLGADIAFRLWAIDIPGGLSILASMVDTHRSIVHENARQFEGDVDLVGGEVLQVKGRVQLSWTSFSPGHAESPAAFRSFSRMRVAGYHPANIDEHMRQYTMRQLRHQGICELATLAAPRVCLRVVLPACRQPIPNVCVEVVAEGQRMTTNEQGIGWLLLRQGEHTVRMKREGFTADWVELQVVIDSMAPQLQLQLPPRLRVWRAPISAGGVNYGYDIWLTPTDAKVDGWEPFSGQLRTANKHIITIRDGGLDAGEPKVEFLDEETPLRPESADPIAGLELMPPFARHLPSEGPALDAGLLGLLGPGPLGPPSPDMLLLQDSWEPLHLGTCLQKTHGEDAADTGMPAGAIALAAAGPMVVRAVSACCAAPIEGVRVRCADRGDATLVTMSHVAIGDKPSRQMVYLARDVSNVPVEIPLLFESKLFFFCVECGSGAREVRLAASACAVPEGATPFTGRVADSSGKELTCIVAGRSNCVQPMSLLPVSSPVGQCACPVAGVSLHPDAFGYLWQPQRPSPLTPGACCLM